MTYRLLEEESKRIVLEFEVDSLLPPDLLEIGKFLNKLEDFEAVDNEN